MPGREAETKVWHGSPITTCQLCGQKIEDAFVDGKTDKGSWAIMCATCFTKHGSGIGIGKGQLYHKVWEKV